MTTLMTALLLAVKNQMRTQEKMSSVDLSLCLVFCGQRTMTIMKIPKRTLKRLRINLEISLCPIQQNSEKKQNRGEMPDGATDHQVQPLRNAMSSVNKNNNQLLIIWCFYYCCFIPLGGPRGQGQDKDTIIARRNKTENKTRGANHNRRYMADRKRREF